MPALPSEIVFCFLCAALAVLLGSMVSILFQHLAYLIRRRSHQRPDVCACQRLRQ